MSVHVCTSCNSPNSSKFCSVCMSAYCSPACQTADWPSHKPICKGLKLQLFASAKLSAVLSKSFTMAHADPAFRLAPVSYTKDTPAPPLGKLVALNQYQLTWRDEDSHKGGVDIFKWDGTESESHSLAAENPTSCSLMKGMEIMREEYCEAAGGIHKLAASGDRSFYGLVLNYVTYGTAFTWAPCHCESSTGQEPEYLEKLRQEWDPILARVKANRYDVACMYGRKCEAGKLCKFKHDGPTV